MFTWNLLSKWYFPGSMQQSPWPALELDPPKPDHLNKTLSY